MIEMLLCVQVTWKYVLLKVQHIVMAGGLKCQQDIM